MKKLTEGTDPMNWSEANWYHTGSTEIKFSEPTTSDFTIAYDSSFMVHNPRYICPVHGETEHVITSTMKDEIERRCMECYWENVIVPNTEKVINKKS